MSYSNHRSSPLLALALALPLLSACGGEPAGEGDLSAAPAVAVDSPAAAVAVPAPAALAEPAGPTTDLPPNELGEILVLEYHRLGEPEGEFVREAENFQKDLQSLYEKGYRPITMRQVLEGNIDVPRGTTPVVFTIDDSSRGQFYLRDDGSIDPGTMVGMWNAFREANPAWKHGATWCVLPAADHPSNFFGEKASRDVPREQREAAIHEKVGYLIQHGHEICNHTLYHARLDKGTDAQVQEWIGRGEDSIRVYLPDDYQFATLALPLGMWPKTRSLAWKGTWPGREGQDRPVAYEYGAILEVSGDANESPYDVKFDPHSVDRFIVGPGRLERQLEAYERDPSRRFVSDGDADVISVPQGKEGSVDTGRWSGKRVQTVGGATQ